MQSINPKEWQAFFKEGKLPAQGGCVVDSWKVSREKEVDPHTPLMPLDEQAWAQPSGVVYNHLSTLIHNITRVLPANQAVWVWTDEEGQVLEVFGNDEPFKESMAQTGLVPGASLAEDQAGTNAVSLAMTLNRLSICRNTEHYKEVFAHISAVASPIYDIGGSLKGYLGLFSKSFQTHDVFELRATRQNLRGLLVLMIQSLDRELRLERSKWAHGKERLRFRQLCADNHVPTVIVNRSGFVRQINPAAMEWLGLGDKLKGQKSLDKLAAFEPTISEIARSAQPYKEKPMSIKLEDKTLDVTYEKQPLYDENDSFVGVMLRFYEKMVSEEDNTSALETRYTFKDILAETPALKEIKELAMKAAVLPVDILLTGESGTGKEVFAQSIHNASSRANHPFITINCAAIPKELAESEFFGYTPGAFTGAKKEGTIGKVEAAHGGTLFLDEIGDMPYELQAKLLRVLENRTITRVGATQQQEVDIRVIAATNRNIPQLIAKDLFREDLYYRISATTIALPSLKDSQENIPVLVQGFLDYFLEQMGKQPTAIDTKVMEAFGRYAWPGNVRELRNAIQFAAMVIGNEEAIGFEHLPGPLRMALLYQQPEEPRDPLHEERKKMVTSEKAMFDKALTMAGGNASKAAKILGISRATYYRRIKAFEKEGVSLRD